MNRRGFLAAVSGLPFLGFLRRDDHNGVTHEITDYDPDISTISFSQFENFVPAPSANDQIDGYYTGMNAIFTNGQFRQIVTYQCGVFTFWEIPDAEPLTDQMFVLAPDRLDFYRKA